jgi:hypothetical protein
VLLSFLQSRIPWGGDQRDTVFGAWVEGTLGAHSNLREGAALA